MRLRTDGGGCGAGITPRLLLVAAAVAAGGSACSHEDGVSLAIDVFAETPSALSTGAEITVLMVELESGRKYDTPRTPVAADVGEAGSLRVVLATRSAKIERTGREIAIVELPAGGMYLVQLRSEGPEGLFAATRCYTLIGRSTDEVLLVGPIDASLDADGDGWTVQETCRERDLDMPGCEHQCPDQWALDCDDDEPGTNVGEADVCEDGVDQDCDGQDAACGS